ncbi:MAG: hypothetical protein ACI84O_001198 [Myxococcota bacterium]|jgi:hypothetical protein
MRYVWLLALGCVACATPTGATDSNDAQLVLREIGFMFPQQLAEVERSITRTTYARLRAAELGLEIDDGLVDQALNEMMAQIKSGIDGSLEDWAQAEHATPFVKVREIYRQHLYNNLLYRSVFVADAHRLPQIEVKVLANRRKDAVSDWLRALELGQHPDGLGAATELMPQWDSELYAPGSVMGPWQLPNRVWVIGRVMAVSPPLGALDSAEIQEKATNYKLSSFAAEVWIHEMSSRYTTSH